MDDGDEIRREKEAVPHFRKWVMELGHMGKHLGTS